MRDNMTLNLMHFKHKRTIFYFEEKERIEQNLFNQNIFLSSIFPFYEIHKNFF